MTTFVDDFYFGSRNNDDRTHSITQVTDDAFIGSVWRWLGRHPDVSIGPSKQHNKTPLFSLSDPGLSLAEQSSTLPHVSVTEDRIYQAICGHPRDDKRVFRSEYGLLLVIAAARSDGILQGELGRVAGQDKRSVPKRTDVLHTKGYVIKEATILRGFKSSRLTLRRFATPAQLAQANVSTSDHPAASRQERTVRDVVDDVIRVLSGASLAELDDLSSRVKMSTRNAQKALSRILRILVKAGFIKKVKAAVGASAHTGEPKICFRRQRDFDDTDLDGFADGSFELDRPIAEVLEETDEASYSEAPGDVSQGHALVQWNPDRNVINAIQHAALLAGSGGINTASIREVITGLNMRRPIESQLARISFASLLTQPEHLRHLSLIRTNKGTLGGPQYAHYAFPAFMDRLKKGKVDSAAVPGASTLLRSERKVSQSTADHTPAQGFSNFPPIRSRFLLHNGNASLAECLRSVRVADMGTGHEDASSDDDDRLRKRLKPGPTMAVDPATTPASPLVGPVVPTTISPLTGRVKRKYQKKQPAANAVSKGNVIKGRPRKFLAGTEKFWQYHFQQAKLDADGPSASKSGTMSHPAGKALFESRPSSFDETVVKAREAKLPLPKLSGDISEAWIAQTLGVLQRNRPGAYVTPTGMHLSRVSHLSRKLIIRSDKLALLDFREQPKVYAYRFLTSMVAHSSQARRWYPSKAPRKKQAKPLPPPKLEVEHPDELLDVFGKSPRKGVFYGSPPAPYVQTPQSRHFDVPKATAEEYRELLAETDVDSEAERQEEQSRADDSPKQVPTRDLVTTSMPPNSVQPVRTQSVSSNASLGNQIDETGDAPAGRQSKRRRKLTQRAVGWIDSGNIAASVGSPSVISDAAVTSEGGEYVSGGQDDADDATQLPVVPKCNAQPDSGLGSPQTLPNHRPIRHQELRAIPTYDVAIAEDIDMHQLKLVNAHATVEENAPMEKNPVAGTSSAEVMDVLQLKQADVHVAAEEAPPVNRTVVEEKSAPVGSDDAAREMEMSVLMRTEKAAREEERARMLSSRGPRGAGSFCRRALMGLAIESEGVVPKDYVLLRQCCGKHWRQYGQSGLPSVSTIKSSIQGLIDAGLLKQHTFSFRTTIGVMQSRSIVYFPEMLLTHPVIAKCKQQIIGADKGQYVPDKWRDLLAAAAAAAVAEEIEVPETTNPEVEESPSPQPESPESEPPVPESPARTTPTPESSVIASPLKRSNTRPRGAAARTPRQISSASLGSRPVSLSPSRMTGFLSRRTTRSPSVASNSAAGASDDNSINTGFLTLKVPRLGALPQVQQFNANFQQAEHLKNVPPVAPVEEPPKPVRQRKPRVAKPKKDSSLQKVIWKTPRVPTSLGDLLADQYEHEAQSQVNAAWDETEVFYREVQGVQSWEHRLTSKLIETKAPWTFINHASSISTGVWAEPVRWLSVNFAADGEASEAENVSHGSWLPFVQALEKSRLEPGLGSNTTGTPSKGRVTRQTTGSIRNKRRFDFADIEVEEDRPRKRRYRKQPDTDFDDEDADVGNRVKRPYNRNKANSVESHHISLLSRTSNEDIFRIAVSVILARTLAGGPDKAINWNIVNKMNPALLRSTVVSRWKAIAYLYQEQISTLTLTLREAYLAAVESAEVPMLNFSSHGDSPWTEILNWALSTLPNFLNENILPASRTELLDKYSVEYNGQHNIRPLLLPGTTMRTYEREGYIVSVPFSSAVSQATPSRESVDSARALIISTLLTPAFTSATAELAAQQLSSISMDQNAAEQATATALRELLSERIILKTNTALKRMPPLLENGRRAYTLADKIDDSLETNRIINHTLLKEAMDYKLEILDETFAANEVVEIPNQASITNGQMVTIVNLLSCGMIRMRPGTGSQKSRYGVAWERVGYQSKQFEPKDLGFDVVIERAEEYIYGDFAEATRSDAPRSDRDGRWPLWIDVNGEVLTDMWEKVLAAVIGIASMRPGVAAVEIKEMLDGVLTQWEVVMTLHWAETQDFVRRTAGGDGWETSRDWWMCLGRDTDWG